VVREEEFQKVQQARDRLFEELVATQSKAIRLRQQLVLLDSREKELFEREMASVEEQERMEQEQEQLIRESREAPPVPASSSGSAGPPVVGVESLSRFSPFCLGSPSGWDFQALNSSGGTGSPAAGNS
jgi:hypothetical protein